MLTRKVWITKDVEHYKLVTRHWVGLYLFGFIPLFKDNYKTVYD